MCSEAGRLQEEKELLVEVIQEPGCSPYPRGWRYPHLGDGQLLEVPERALPPPGLPSSGSVSLFPCTSGAAAFQSAHSLTDRQRDL